MSKEIKRFEQLPPDVITKQEESGEEFRVGDIFFDNDGDTILRISKLRQESRWANNDPKDKKKVKYWEVVIQRADDWEATKFHDYGSEDVEDFLKGMRKGKYTKITRPLSEVMAEANKVITGEINIESYQQSEYDGSMNEERAVIGKDSKSGLIAIQKSLELKKRTADLIHKAISYEMEKRKQALNRIKDQMYGAVAKFEKQIKKIRRVITTIELYLGINEDIHQIQEGEKAPSDTPICFRQLLLFIDEEVGVHEDGGLDWKGIEEFDKWLLQDNHLDIVLPEKKGMVALKPRRKDKHYSDNPWLNSFLNEENRTFTYFLIRNGDNVYRVFTPKIIIEERLFPQRHELEKLAAKFEDDTWMKDEEKKDKLDDKIYPYKKQAIFMQGLLDRTEIFHPLPVEKINIFKLHEAGEYIRFIYDDELNLPSGRLAFHDWWKKIDESIKEGSRILITGEFGYNRRDWSDRFYLARNSYDGLKDVPDLPGEGLYEVEQFTSSYVSKLRLSEYEPRKKELTNKKIKFDDLGKSKTHTWVQPDSKTGSREQFRLRIYDREPALTIMYKPEKEAKKGWNDWSGHDRKNRTRFKIEIDDPFIMNYDQIDLEDIDFYLHSRVDRPNYLSMMPVLKMIRKQLIKELKNEQDFSRFVADRNEKTLSQLSRKQIEKRVSDAIKWWKYKNKWKRAITKDDTLALRMIEKRITSKNYDKLKITD